ncbi:MULTISPECIES: MaoC/PaaZ C-terminal domain-containing protein [Methylosinus]|uniref:Dehydratase n=1 Tax=Methylosinus trichosporium (strain ATCC 35070 / NCIMB 11131 / UNIQEM 75 / OB3b) TaxID=595536 RepID=A0A2D2D2D8_METT3|nr:MULTISPECIES: MaoC/PaaZ C-terminal domain-containing protein [Methylosinus]ATQ69150.1 dehydratase [Methylosinus trichosporium OB3b]OBS53574.1 dehydratase [Methylosinus sp. 3S-1]
MTLHLEDLAVGQRFHAGPVEVTREAVEAFATQFDPQPFHLDAETARATFFHEQVASGWHTAALTMRMLTQCAPLAGGLIGTGGRIEWTQPVRPGDQLSVEAEILSVAARPGAERGVVEIRVTTSNQTGETVQRLTAKILAFTRQDEGG